LQIVVLRVECRFGNALVIAFLNVTVDTTISCALLVKY